MKILNQKVKDELWWLLIAADYDESRITIADHDINEETLTLWLEDKHDFKNTLDECLEVVIPIAVFAGVIKAEGLNSYEGDRLHPVKKYIYKTRIEIDTPINWYRNDADVVQQQWAREAALKKVFEELMETV